MELAQLISIIANFVTASAFAALSWLFVDALVIRIEIKTLLKTFGFGFLTLAFALNLVQTFSNLGLTQMNLYLWLAGIGLWLIFAAFILDPHCKLQFLVILAIVLLFFLKGNALLSMQAFLIAATILQIAYFTKHKDLIPMVVAFVLVAIGEFFYSLQKQTALGNLQTGGDFLYIFASIALFWWLWQYLVIRFNLQRKTAF